MDLYFHKIEYNYFLPKYYQHKDYEKHVLVIKNYLNNFSNLYPIGRSGMFKYNNQDYAIATGIYMASNLIDENFDVDIWNINSEGVYVEGEIKY